jgi:hypothetical protein
MSSATSLIGLAALSSTALATTIKYHHVLQASFVGTNHLSYQIYADDELMCSSTVDTSEFGDSTFRDQCDDTWTSECHQEKDQTLHTLTYHDKVALQVDAGNYGQVSLSGLIGSTPIIPPWTDLQQDAPDKQYGCGNTLCIGIQEERSCSFEWAT